MKETIRVATFNITENQRDFLKEMKIVSGQTTAAYLRELINREMKREKWGK